MIRNQWYAILESNEIKTGRLLGVTRLGEKLVVWRTPEGEVTCMHDLCPHRGVALSAGKILVDRIQCPFHGFQYDASGRCQVIPANGKGTPVPKAFRVYTYPAREANGFIWIWWGEARSDLPPLPFFETIDDAFSTMTFRDHWSVHYSRAIENQLDAVHLPFVHHNTIGRGGRTIVNGPLVRWESGPASPIETMNIWVNNRADEGQPPLKADEMPEPNRHPSLQFRFPNLWHNWISDTVRIMVAFAPIDEENTLIYLRFYQKAVGAPILRQVFNVLAQPLNIIVLRQDKRVVLTQRPKRTDLRMGEKMIPGDGPIIAYRRRRQEMIDQAGEWPVAQADSG